MKEILVLNRYGSFVIQVDDADFEQFNGKLYVNVDAKKGYKSVRLTSGGGLFHRVITSAPKGLEVDHIDGNPLNNQRSNLRLCSHRDNSRNLRKYKNSKTPFKGVQKTRSGRWQARISLSLGVFDTPEQAAIAYDRAIKQIHGEFSSPNFPLKESS